MRKCYHYPEFEHLSGLSLVLPINWGGVLGNWVCNLSLTRALLLINCFFVVLGPLHHELSVARWVLTHSCTTIRWEIVPSLVHPELLWCLLNQHCSTSRWNNARSLPCWPSLVLLTHCGFTIRWNTPQTHPPWPSIGPSQMSAQWWAWNPFTWLVEHWWLCNGQSPSKGYSLLSVQSIELLSM